MSELAYKRTNVYEVADEKLMKEIFSYAEGYKKFLDEGKNGKRGVRLRRQGGGEKGL